METGEFLVTIMLFVLAIPILLMFFQQEECDFYYEEYTVQAGDTFWKLWNERYYTFCSYDEACYLFKQDNNKQDCFLYKGEKLKMRVYLD